MPRVLRAVTAVLLVNVAISQQAADKKKAPENCGDLKTQMEITNCWESVARKADADLAVLYQKIQKAIQAKMTQDAQFKEYNGRALVKLKTAQLAWTHYRDSQCDAAEQQFEGGTIAPSVAAGCHKDLADQRIKELHDTYAIYLKSQ